MTCRDIIWFVSIFGACAVLSVGVLGLPYPIDILATLVMSVAFAIAADMATSLKR